MKKRDLLDVAVVGAGAAGVGMGVVLKDLGVRRFTLLEKSAVGATFSAWPEDTRFLSPSFPSNDFKLMDLNSVALFTSPAYLLRTEHPSGKEYAAYLQGVAKHFKLPVRTGAEVSSVRREDGGFALETPRGTVRARFVVWATGEFARPRLPAFPGREHGRHSSRVKDWSEFRGREVVVVGGAESGCDAAHHLARRGKRVTVLEKAPSWNSTTTDPSQVLSPYTFQRLRPHVASGKVRLVGGDVTAIEPRGRKWLVHAGRKSYSSDAPPVLATGFESAAAPVRDLWEWREDGQPRLTADDESTKAPGLFLAGPSVRQEKVVFCFIYKFRQRFAVVGRALARRLKLSEKPLEVYREHNMFLDDLSCCGQDCVC